MRSLVTGGAGFIGSALVDALLAGGGDTMVIDDLSRGRRDQVAPQASFQQLDIRDDALATVLRNFRPEVVFHLAAQIDVRRSVAEPLLDTTINVAGTVNLLTACAQARVRRFVFASSGGTVYGETERLPTPETHPCRPESVYGAAKLAGELYADVFSRLHGLEAVSLRYGNVYGPRQDPHGEAGVVAIFIHRLLDGAEVVINGDGAQTRDYVYVDDVVRANLAAANTGRPGVYNIGTGRETDVNEIHQRIAAACGVDGQARHAAPRPGEQRRSCLAIDRAVTGLDWRPSIDLATGIDRTVDYFRGR